ncbi:MAG: signal peptidase I [Oscillospiraceae bacterium]|nr:signal peptidase I [Oscillospiraceae bacterium]
MSEEEIKVSNEPETAQTQKSGKDSWQKELYTELRMLAVILTVTILMFHFLTQLVVVVGSSMYPTLHDGDLLIAWRLNYEPEQGDIVVLHKETPYIQETIVKRIIATGGQTVEIDYEENAVYVDGVRIQEDYLNQEDADIMEEKGDVLSIDVPEGSVFVMGDNRNRSTDSRFTAALGVVDEDYIIGKALFIFFPFQHAGLLEN